MRKHLIGSFAIALAAFAIASCAVLGGGQTDPVLSAVFHDKVLSQNGAILLGNATLTCNAQAATDYNSWMVPCANPTAAISNVPLPMGMTSAQAVLAVTSFCNVHGFTAGMPAVIQPGACVFGSPAPSMTSTPSATSTPAASASTISK